MTTTALAAFLNVAICKGVVAFTPEGSLCILNDMAVMDGQDACDAYPIGTVILMGHTFEGKLAWMTIDDLVLYNEAYGNI